MEVNYLLQRVEEYAGVVILASNLRQNIDEAFLRRIQWAVDFPFPDADARFHIYRRVFPDTVRYPGDAQLRDLAERFRLTGGSIKNVVVDATFRALVGYDLKSGRPPRIHVSHLVLAIAREYQKLSMPISRGEFGETYYRYVECKILEPQPNP
jgi:SpoVK/Ycf46/Vps4 family AAA+-type ATPase